MTPKNFVGFVLALVFISLTAACGGSGSVVGPIIDDPTPAPSTEKMTLRLTVTVGSTEVLPVNGNEYHMPAGTDLFTIAVTATLPQVEGRTFRFCTSLDATDCSNYSSSQRHVDWPQGYRSTRTYGTLAHQYFEKYEEQGPGLPGGVSTTSVMAVFR